MHKIERNEGPEELKEKSIEFNKKIKNGEDIEDAWTKFSNTKLKKQTLERLTEMFLGCCAYCEGSYADTSYPQIEHFKPKSLYPELMFEYSNMNISCQKCNNYKSNKFDELLINPTVDEPDEHLKYVAYLMTALDERGVISIDTYGLNDEERIGKKEKEYNKIKNRLDYIKEALDNINNENLELTNELKKIINSTIDEVEAMFENGFEYCTMYVHNFKEDIEYLKEIVKAI